MKKILSTILGLVCIFAIFFAGASNPDGSVNIWWTASCIVIAIVCGVIWFKLQPKPVHIPDEVYDELNMEIKACAAQVETDDVVEIGAMLPNDCFISLVLHFSAQTARSQFIDDIWGWAQSVTETNWTCKCEVRRVRVFDKKGREKESDFDRGRIELEYESTQWS